MPRRKNTADCYDVFVNIWRKKEAAAENTARATGAPARTAADGPDSSGSAAPPSPRELTGGSGERASSLLDPATGGPSARRPLLGAPKDRSRSERPMAPGAGFADDGCWSATGSPVRLLGAAIDPREGARGRLPRWIEHPGGDLSRSAGELPPPRPAAAGSGSRDDLPVNLSPNRPAAMVPGFGSGIPPREPANPADRSDDASSSSPLVIELLEARERFPERLRSSDPTDGEPAAAGVDATRWSHGDSQGTPPRAPDEPGSAADSGGGRLPAEPDGCAGPDDRGSTGGTPSASWSGPTLPGVSGRGPRAALLRLAEAAVRWLRGVGKATGGDFGAAPGAPASLRASTWILVALSVAIVVGLIGLWLRLEPVPSNLHQRFFDDRAGDVGSAADSAADSVSAQGGAAQRAPGGNSSRGRAGFSAAAGAGALVRPVWSRADGSRDARPASAGVPSAGVPSAGISSAGISSAGISSAGGPSAGGSRLPGTGSGAAEFGGVGGAGGSLALETPESRWLRVRAKMDKDECVQLLDHLARLRGHLENRHGCVEQSIACKSFDPEVSGSGEDARYAVDIGPFASYRMAQQAAAELRRLTAAGSWRFKSRGSYFQSAYVFKRSGR